MKKIYILTAVFALLTLSLNAQLTAAKKKVVKPETSTEKVATPPDGYFRMGPSRASTDVVTTFPYTNGFDDTTEQNWWEIIDANSDGSTWEISSYRARYRWHGRNSANDWLVTAPVYLVAGRTYKFYIDAAAGYSTWPEKLEVKLASANDATALSNGATIIAETTLTNEAENFITLSNENVKVTTTGNYYFGIHAISDANMYYLYVDDLKIDVEAGPTIEVSPNTLTISDNGTNNTFTVQGKNLGTDNVGVTVPNGSAFSTTTSDKTWGFENTTGSVEGTVTVTYGGRALRATETVTVANNLTSATVAVTYVPDLYIYCDNGASPWDFSANPAVAMTNNGDGTYTATLEDIPANSHILFGRASGLTYGWEGDNNRLFFGASTDGGDWGYGDNTSGYLDTNAEDDYPVKYHPIYFSEGGTYIVTIDANAYTFSIIGKTATPTITVVANADGSKTVSATGDGTVHLYVDGVEVSNPYIIPSSTDGDKTYTVTATAQEEGKLISETATETVTVAEAGRTPTPAIDVEEHNGYVVITAYGDGTVTLSAGGQTATSETGTATITIVKSNEEQTVTATATAQDGDLAQSYPATRPVTIPALTTDPTTALEGLLRLHLLMVDQMFEDIPDDNSHPDRYNYVLRYEPNGPSGDGVKESSTVHVDIQKADCEVTGYYSLKQIDNDKNIGLDHKQGITMDVVTADVAYNLSNNNDKLYEYILQGATDRIPEYQKDYLTKLRKSQNFTYFEMWEKSPNKGREYPNGEHHYLDSLMIGTYGSSFRSYAPSVSTDGIERRYYEDDGYDNTYGAPIWKTAVGDVKMSEDEAPKAERQTNAWNSVNWMDKDANGNDAPASLYILDNIWATAKLPHTQIATVQYEPYMFRIFVESKNGLLRPYEIVPEGSGETDGEHLAPVDRELTEADVKGPLCVWSGYLQFDEDGEVIGDQPNGVKVQIGTAEGGQKTYTYNKMKVDRTGGSNANPLGEWDKDANNAMFGALDALAISGYDSNGKPIMNTDITSDDLNIFVRFYYVVKGMADGWEPGSRGQGDNPAGYGTESPGTSPEPATGVNEIQFLGEIVSQTYYNVQGMQSDQPFDGINIVVTRYSNGTTSVTKVVR